MLAHIPADVSHQLLTAAVQQFGESAVLHVPGRMHHADRIGLVTFTMRWSLIDALDAQVGGLVMADW